MKPHALNPSARRFCFGASAGLLLLVSACSTFAPSDPGPVAEAVEAPAVAAEDPRPSAAEAGDTPAPSSKVKRAVSARPRVPNRLDPLPYAGPEQAESALQALIDTAPDEAGADNVPVAGPVPKLEPLAAHANRPYRLRGKKYRPMTDLQPFRQRGVASWYGKPFHGRRTATGERYDMHAMSAAHPTLPLPSYVKVTNLKTGTSVIVRVNDRGPFAHGRVIDLSHAAAKHLGVLQGGVAAVELNLIVPEPAGTQMPAPVAGFLD